MAFRCLAIRVGRRRELEHDHTHPFS
jgi:hypothetical protein